LYRYPEARLGQFVKILLIKEYKMNRSVLIIILGFFLLMPFYSADAAEVRAFHNINQLPFKQIFGLPSLDNSPLTEAGTWRFNLISNISNNYSYSATAHEQLRNDGETFRGTLLINYGLRDNLQLSVEIPYIHHSEGFLDDFIYDWHDFFNMPQSGRTKTNNDQFNITYLSDGGSGFSLTTPENGLGDIRIGTVLTRPWNNRALIFSAELKFPTGDFDKFTGSGGYDFSLGLMLNDPYSLEKHRITLYGGLAGLYLGDMDSTMSDIQHNFMVAGRVGIGWQATKLIQLKLQLDTQSPLYDSDLKDLGESAFQLVTGGSLIFTDNVYLDISVAEDIRTLTAADVAIQLALVATF
jgi:Protein of unknown function (DUF3187)